MICLTANCGKPATRHHRWRAEIQVERIGPRGGRKTVYAPEGEWIDADYCEQCSWNLNRRGNDDVTPPWPLAKVLPFQRA